MREIARRRCFDNLRMRAREAAAQLIGHGVMNRLIAREPVAAGWLDDDRHRSGDRATVRFRTPLPASAHPDGPL